MLKLGDSAISAIKLQNQEQKYHKNVKGGGNIFRSLRALLCMGQWDIYKNRASRDILTL